MRTYDKLITSLLIASSLMVVVAGCGSPATSHAQSAAGSAGSAPLYAKATTRNHHSKTSTNGDKSDSGSYNMAAPIVPDPKLTPGDTLDVTSQDFCTPGYSKKVRNVPQAVKAQAYKEYGITHREKGEYEVDHLISLELGGSNSIKNLWPESYKTQPLNAHVKDTLENRLHELICSGQLDAKVAQQAIARDWVSAYLKYVGPLPTDGGGRDTITDPDEADNTGSNAPGYWAGT